METNLEASATSVDSTAAAGSASANDAANDAVATEFLAAFDADAQTREASPSPAAEPSAAAVGNVLALAASPGVPGPTAVEAEVAESGAPP